MSRMSARVATVCFMSVGGLLAMALARAPEAGQDAARPKFPSPYVDAQGGITFPTDYRLKWTHLGSWSVTEENKDFGMHDVYAEPDAVRDFRKTGTWRDGAMIIKEVRAGREDKLTTGQARWDGEIKVWFVMVKDSRKSFPDNPNWGRGWGWALYDKADPKTNTSKDYKLDCIACHVPAQDTDWIYQRGYPVLNERDGPFKPYPRETYDAPAPKKP